MFNDEVINSMLKNKVINKSSLNKETETKSDNMSIVSEDIYIS
jgi:hypothetical protein